MTPRLLLWVATMPACLHACMPCMSDLPACLLMRSFNKCIYIPTGQNQTWSRLRQPNP